MLEYGNAGMMWETEYRLRGTADRRPAVDPTALPIGSSSNIPVFHHSIIPSPSYSFVYSSSAGFKRAFGLRGYTCPRRVFVRAFPNSRIPEFAHFSLPAFANSRISPFPLSLS
jgi:hypothetical protein